MVGGGAFFWVEEATHSGKYKMVSKDEHIGHKGRKEIFLLWPWKGVRSKEENDWIVFTKLFVSNDLISQFQ